MFTLLSWQLFIFFVSWWSTVTVDGTTKTLCKCGNLYTGGLRIIVLVRYEIHWTIFHIWAFDIFYKYRVCFQASWGDMHRNLANSQNHTDKSWQTPPPLTFFFLFNYCNPLWVLFFVANNEAHCCRKFGYVDFGSEEELQQALGLNGKKFMGQPIKLDRAKSKEDSQESKKGNMHFLICSNIGHVLMWSFCHLGF